VLAKVSEIAHHVHDWWTIPAMGCNERLATVCKGLRISDFVLTSPLGRGRWAPLALELCAPANEGEDAGIAEERHLVVPWKTFADVVESILGLVYVNCGFEEACAVADELQLSFPIDRTRSPGLQNNQIRPKPKPNLIAAASAFTGHMKWLKHELVEEAFTHPTALHPVVPSYQRLEWVGDAVLCLSIREWIYHNFNSLPVGDSVMLSAALESKWVTHHWEHEICVRLNCF
jgi:dsRNA-specific ribonuclease